MWPQPRNATMLNFPPSRRCIVRWTLGDRMKTASSYPATHWSRTYSNCINLSYQQFFSNHVWRVCAVQKIKISILLQGKSYLCLCTKITWELMSHRFIWKPVLVFLPTGLVKQGVGIHFLYVHNLKQKYQDKFPGWKILVINQCECTCVREGPGVSYSLDAFIAGYIYCSTQAARYHDHDVFVTLSGSKGEGEGWRGGVEGDGVGWWGVRVRQVVGWGVRRRGGGRGL